MYCFTSGLCLGVPVDDKEAFISLIVVDESYRGKGIGKQLLQRSVTALGNKNISLYGSAQAVPLYRKYGFSSESNPTYLYQTKFFPKEGVLGGKHFNQSIVI